MHLIKWLTIVVVVLASSGCKKSLLHEKVPVPTDVDKCIFARDKKSGQFFFGCNDWNAGVRPSYYKDLNSAAKEIMYCMSSTSEAKMQNYDEKVARRITWLERELASCQSR